jgi:glycogen(starch) synthase
MRVLRLCSVYEAPPESLTGTRGFDAIGGMQVHTARLTAALDALGIDQTVITAYRPRAPRSEPVGERSRVVRAGVPLRRLRQLYGLGAVPEVVKAGRVDAVHVHLGEDLAIGPLARWAASRSGAPMVVTVHCSARHTIATSGVRSAILRTLSGRVEDGLLGAADAILVLTDRLADRLARSGVPASRIRVVPVGIDLEAFRRPLPRPPSMDDRRWVVYVGRLVPEKGVRELVAALAGTTASDAGLLVVGDGPDRAALEALAQSLGVAHRVRFVGPVPHTDVPPFLQHADLAVLPSWYEERGRVLLEAMAAGAPVVATRTGGIPATVRHGVNGLLVPPREPDRLAEAIDRVLGDEAFAASMRDAGRATASEHGVDGLVEATLDAYETVIARAADRRRAGLTLVEAP